MFPSRLRLPSEALLPPVHSLLLWTLLLAFGLEVALAGGPGALRGTGGGSSLLTMGSPDVFTLWAAGSPGPRAVLDNGEWWRLFAGMFLHAGFVHLGFNLFALFQLGRICDEVYTRFQAALIFLLTGLVGFIASCAWSHFNREAGLSLGASGAVCGILGALLAYMRGRVDALGRELARRLLTWAVIILVFGLLVGSVDNAAHVGGFAAGFLLGSLLPGHHLVRLGAGWRLRLQQWGTVLLVLGTVASLVIAGAGAPARKRWITRSVKLQGTLEELHGELGRSRPRLQGVLLSLENQPLGPALEPSRSRALAVVRDPRLSPAGKQAAIMQELVRMRRGFLERAPDLLR